MHVGHYALAEATTHLNLTHIVSLALCVIVGVRFLAWFVSIDEPLHTCLQGEVNLQADVFEVKAPNTHPPRLLLNANILSVPACEETVTGVVRLSWYRPKAAIAVGDRIEIVVRLKRPWGALNPGAFNYRSWLLSKGVRATGSIVTVNHIDASTTESSNPGSFNSGSFNSESFNSEWEGLGLIQALALGEKSGVSDAEWALFRRTGTIHLMVVSGLHVGIFATLCAALLGLLATPVLPFLYALPKRKIIFVGAAVGIIGYAQITGLHPPVVRATTVFLLLGICLLLNRRLGVILALFTVAVLSALAQPSYLLQQGYWLSYGAVAALAVTFAYRLRYPTWTAGFIICQIALLLGLSPILAVVVGSVPTLSPLANLLVVPVVTLIGIPASMVYVLAHALAPGSWIAQGALLAAHHSMHLVLAVLGYFPASDFGYLGLFQAALGYGCFLVIVLPVSVRFRVAAFLIWLIALLNVPERVSPGEYIVRTLDVGQGSAAIIDTRTHRMLVDLGARYSSGFDSGASIVIPAIRRTGNDRVDRVLVTHSDNDHAGGLTAVMQRYPNADMASPEIGCADGERWQWDGVEFMFMRLTNALDRNNGSCTLAVTGRTRSVFFPGDIGRGAELALLRRLPHDVDLLVAPHHGSRTSSHPAFVDRLNPTWLVVSAGRNNRYKHPHTQVVERYLKQGATVVNTAQSGYLIWHSETNRMTAGRSKLGTAYVPITKELDRDM